MQRSDWPGLKPKYISGIKSNGGSTEPTCRERWYLVGKISELMPEEGAQV